MTGELAAILILLIAANGAPVLIARLLGERYSLAVDFGRNLSDGRPIFGPSKTWRGVAGAIALCAATAPLLGFDAPFGMLVGSLAVTGDLCSSFIKRRVGLAASARCPGLDQLPEALLPSLYAVHSLGHAWWWAVLLALLFMALAMLLSRPLFLLHIRNQPH